jgi:acetyl-CoA acyltransferase 2
MDIILMFQTSTDAPYIARHVGLKSGVPDSSIALTVNRLCGSGFQSIINGAQEIKLGESDVVLTGGTESMSQAPYAVRDARFGSPLGKDLKVCKIVLSNKCIPQIDHNVHFYQN